MGGKQAGCVGLLTLYAGGFNPIAVVAYDENVKQLAGTLSLPTFSSIRDSGFKELLSTSDILVSVHGREIVPDELLAIPRLGGINVHPCLFGYKGTNPVERFLKDGLLEASVGVHCMTATVDEGPVLVEEFVGVEGKETAEEVYNALYPYYSTALLKALAIMRGRLQTAWS